MNDDINLQEGDDVTELFMKFREGARHLWNTCLVDDCDWEIRDYFSAICQRLFTAIVLYPLNRLDLELPSEGEGYSEPMRCFELRWEAKREMSIIINCTIPQGSCWGEPIKSIPMNGTHLLFIRFFDWGQLEARDFFYYQVFIDKLPAYPHLEGRVALVEVNNPISIVYRDGGKTAGKTPGTE